MSLRTPSPYFAKTIRLAALTASCLTTCSPKDAPLARPQPGPTTARQSQPSTNAKQHESQPAKQHSNACSPPWIEQEVAFPPAPTEPTEQPQPTPPPSEWPMPWRKKAAVTAAFCDPVYASRYKMPSAPDIGCASCPDLPARSAQSPLPAEVVLSPLTHTVAGSFSQAGRQEAVAFMQGCGPGGAAAAFLLRRQKNTWHVDRSLGLADSCAKTRIAGDRDVLVCSGGDTNGHSSEQWLSVIDVARQPIQSTLLGVSSTFTLENGLCEDYEPPLRAGLLRAPVLLDIDRDGFNDIAIPAEYAVLAASQAAALRSKPDFRRSCDCFAAMVMNEHRLKPGCTCPTPQLPEPLQLTLEFLHRDGRFVPTSRTQNQLAQLLLTE